MRAQKRSVSILLKKTNPGTESARSQRRVAHMAPRWAETLPNNGRWFVRQQELLTFCDELAEKNGGTLPADTLLVAWDRTNKTGNVVKSYGYYEKYETYFETVMSRARGTANGYELIRADMGANLYLDVEWLGVEDHKHEVVKDIRKLVEHKVNGKRTGPPQALICTVMCSSRQQAPKTGDSDSDPVFKNSYHLTFHGLRFANNHDGAMKAFVLGLGMPDKIDGAVYTKHRTMRTLGCTKLSSEVEFVVIAEDGRRLSREEARSVWRDSLVTVVPSDPYSFIEKVAAGTHTKSRKPSNGGKIAKTAQTDTEPDAPEHDAPAFDSPGLAGLPSNFVNNFVDTPTVVKRGVVKILPPAVELQLVKKTIMLDDLTCLYIQNPKQCAAAFIKQQKSHTHKGNNAIATIVNYKDGRSPDVYVKCLCDCKQGLRPLYNYSNWNTKELPKMSPVAMAVLNTRHGIDEVEDSADRRRVKQMYNEDVNSREQCMKTYSHELMWKRIWPYGDWCFIANPKNRLEGMMAGQGEKRPLTDTPADCGAGAAKAPKTAADPQTMGGLPMGIILRMVGTKVYDVKCPLCPPAAAAVRFKDGVLLRERPLHKTCSVVEAHKYVVCLSAHQ